MFYGVFMDRGNNGVFELLRFFCLIGGVNGWML